EICQSIDEESCEAGSYRNPPPQQQRAANRFADLARRRGHGQSTDINSQVISHWDWLTHSVQQVVPAPESEQVVGRSDTNAACQRAGAKRKEATRNFIPAAQKRQREVHPPANSDETGYRSNREIDTRIQCAGTQGGLSERGMTVPEVARQHR